jgi:hypothetical protein
VTTGQKRRHSLLEACLGTAIGYIIAFVLNYTVLRLWGFKPNITDTFWITNIFTIASVLRGYYVRRLFNWLHVKGML